MPSIVTEIIKQRILSGNKKPVKKPLRQSYPIQYEVKYRKYLLNHISFLKSEINTVLKPFFKEQKAEIDRQRKVDQAPDELEQNLQISKTRAEQDFSTDKVTDFVKNIAYATASYNLLQQRKVFNSALGVDLFFTSSAVDTSINLFIKNNVSLIKSIDTQFFDKLEQTIYNNYRQGLKNSELTKTISKEFRSVKYRAQLIAQDQIQKLNGDLTKLRQEAVGIESYIWRNMKDNRVRGNPSGLYPNTEYNHWKREGKVFPWNNPPADGHPGQAVRCRCFAEPNFEKNIKEAESAIS